MKALKKIIQEKLTISKDSKINDHRTYKYYPKTKEELRSIIHKKNENNKNDILDLNDIDVSTIKDLSYLFENIHLKKVNMNNWDVSKVEDIHGLFWENSTVEEIHIEDWDVKNIKCTYGAFYFCSKLKELNLDKWDLKNCLEFDFMFKGCDNLDTHFTDNWTIPNDDITINGMFDGCKYKPEWYYKNKN